MTMTLNDLIFRCAEQDSIKQHQDKIQWNGNGQLFLYKLISSGATSFACLLLGRHCCSPSLLQSATSSPRGQKLQVLGERGVGCCQEIALFASPAGRKQYFSRNWAHCSPNKNTRSGQHHNTTLPPSTLKEGCNIETNPSLLHLFYSLPNKR